MNDRTDLSPELHGELQAWCASYIAAFESSDISATGEHWAFPAMIITGDRQIILKDADAFNKNTAGLTAFYERQKVQRITRTVLSCKFLGEDTASMRVHDVMSSGCGEQIVDWVAAYALRRTEGGWRAIFADASGEIDAWQARGTPLGSK